MMVINAHKYSTYVFSRTFENTVLAVIPRDLKFLRQDGQIGYLGPVQRRKKKTQSTNTN